MHFAQPLLGGLALLAVPIILLMYLLKQKYKEKQVPSLYLWEKVLTQTKAQEPWQKLRKNLLMFLQIAAAVLLALALSGPYLMGKIQVRDYIIGLDCSLSMQATDVEKSRFDAAKADLMELLENTAPGSRFSLVMLTDTPTLAVSGGEKDVVLRMVENASLTAGGVNWEEAKSLLSAEQEALGGEIVVYTDGYGNLGTLSATEQVYAGDGENTAVTLLSHTAQEDGLYVMARLQHYGKSDQEKTITLYADGAAFDTKTVTVAAGADTDVVFRGVPGETKTLEARISPEDALMADNSRFAGLAAAEQQKVLLVSKSNLFLCRKISRVTACMCLTVYCRKPCRRTDIGSSSIHPVEMVSWKRGQNGNLRRMSVDLQTVVWKTVVTFPLPWQKERLFLLPGAQPFCRQKGRPWGFMEKLTAEKWQF